MRYSVILTWVLVLLVNRVADGVGAEAGPRIPYGDFEDMGKWVAEGCEIEPSTEHVTEGSQSLKVTFWDDEPVPAIKLDRCYREEGVAINLLGWKYLHIDLFNPGKPFSLGLKVKDEGGGQSKLKATVPTGASTQSFKVNYMSGEVDLGTISYISFWTYMPQEEVTLYLDNIRVDTRRKGYVPTAQPKVAFTGSRFDAGMKLGSGGQALWFYLDNNLSNDTKLENARVLVSDAAACGYTGVILSGDLSGVETWGTAHRLRLVALKEHCNAKRVSLVPLVMSAGYGTPEVRANPNLLAGLPVKDAPFLVHNGVAKPVPDMLISEEDGGFETAQGHAVQGFDMQDEPGKYTFVDPSGAFEGRHSLRLENFAENQGRIRVMKTIRNPYKHYILRFRARAEGMDRARMAVSLYNSEREIASVPFDLQNGGAWQKIEVPVQTLDNEEVNVYIGAWGVKTGKLWLDAVELREAGLVNVIRRAGTPVIVKSAKTGDVLREGVAYEPVVDSRLNHREAWHEPAELRLKSGAVTDGERLLVSYYTPVFSRKRQAVLCMSEPDLYEIWSGAASALQEIMAPSMWMLDMDEIRGGGRCETCRARKDAAGKPMTMGGILGACITQQTKIIRKVSPGAEVLCWSDMLDPNHNAHAGYYTVPDPGYTDSWKAIPKDLVIVMWGQAGERTMKHFTGNGFRVMAATYYDEGAALTESRAWKGLLKQTDLAVGTVYATWESRYGELRAFADLMRDGN